ncbi:MAG: hypothetical protein EZS28_003527 [Streblomastix strix]|uniref:Uncharacterized protein n=1 Tax=Streblomastix strix TaxID=222440 RepID=A0A5J4X1N6_9EUKA|nr:MAG: hypothetical protein EZS28_003527 [Streblomastix strix]
MLHMCLLYCIWRSTRSLTCQQDYSCDWRQWGIENELVSVVGESIKEEEGDNKSKERREKKEEIGEKEGSEQIRQNYFSLKVTFEFVKSRCTTKISNATRDSSENRIYAFLQLTPLISTRLDSEIGKIPSPVLQLLFGTIKSIIKNHKRIGNIDNRENLTLHKFLRKFCSFATIAGRVFNWPQCILFLSHLFPIDKTKFVAGRDKYALIQRIPRTTKSYSTYKDLRQIKGQEIHFQLLDKFLKYNGSTFLQSTLKFLTNGQIQGYPAFEMMMSLMRIYYSYFIYTEPRYCPIKEVSQIQTLIVYLPKIYQFPPMGKEERIDKLIRMIEFCGNQANASDNSMEKFLLKISIILLEDGLYQRVQLQNPQAINIVDPNSQQVQQSNSHTLMMKGVHFLNLLAKCSVGIKGQRGQSILDKPKEITLDDITSISNEIYKPSNGNEGIIKLCISLMNFGGQLLCDNLQVKQAGGQENKIQMEMLELAEVQRIYANAFIIPDQLLQDLFTFWEKIPLVQDGAENDPDKIIPKNFFHKAINNSKLELIIPTLTYLERKYWIEPTTQSQGQSSSTLVQLHQVAQQLNILFDEQQKKTEIAIQQQQSQLGSQRQFRGEKFIAIFCSLLMKADEIFTKICELKQQPAHQAFSFYSIGKCFRLNPHKDNDNANWDSEGGIDLLINNILSSIEGTIIKVEQQRQQGGNIREDNSEQEQNVIIDGMEVKGHLNCSSNALQTLMKMRSFEVDAAIEELNKKKIDKDIIPHFESLLQRHKLENVLQLINRLLSVLVERSQGLTGPGKSANIFINLVFENIYRTSFQIIQIQQKLIEKQGQLKLESLNNEDLKTKIVVIFFSYLNRILNPPFNSPYQLMTRFLDFINMFIGMRKIFKSSNLDIENDIDVIGLDSLFQLALNWPIGGQETIQTLERMQIREKYEIGKDVEKVLEQEYQIQTGIWNPALNFLVELGKISEQTKPDVNAHQQNRNNEYYLPNQIIIGECIKRLEDIFRDSNQQQQQSQPASIENKFLIIRLLLLYIQILREKRASILIDPFELVKIPLEGQEGQNLNNNNKNNPPTFMNNYNKPLPSLMIFGTIPPNYRDIRISEEDDIQTLRLRIARDQQVGDYTRVRVNFNNKDITYSRERVLSLTGRINLQDLKFEIGPQTYWNTNGPPKTIIPADPLSNHKQFYSKSNLQDDIKDYENALDVIKSKATMFSNIMNTHPQTKKMIECLLSIARLLKVMILN